MKTVQHLWKKGQVSATTDGGVANILIKLKEYEFSSVNNSVDNLFIGIKYYAKNRYQNTL